MKKLVMILTFALILCFVVDCQDKAAMAELEEFRAQAAIGEQNEALVMEWLEQWDLGNFDTANKYIGDNFVWHLPGGVDLNSAKEFVEVSEAYRTGFPDLKHLVEDTIVEGDKIVLRVIVQATQKGEFMGIPPTEKRVQMTAIVIYKLAEGKCVEGWTESDSLGFMQQLGMELKPKESER